MPYTSCRIRLPVTQNYLYEAHSQVWYVPVDGGVHTVHFQEGTYDWSSLPRPHKSHQDVRRNVHLVVTSLQQFLQRWFIYNKIRIDDSQTITVRWISVVNFQIVHVSNTSISGQSELYISAMLFLFGTMFITHLCYFRNTQITVQISNSITFITSEYSILILE